MTDFNPRRYLAVETAIGVAINVLVAAAPALASLESMDTLTLRPLRDVAVDLTPQFLMCAFMSALVPSLLTRRRQSSGRLGSDEDGVRPSLVRSLVVAAVLAASFTLLTLASMHLMLPWLIGNRLGSVATVILRGAQGALAAVIVTPVALIILFGPKWTWTSLPSS